MLKSTIVGLCKWLRAISVVGAIALGGFAGIMALSNTAALAAAPEEPHTEAPSPLGSTTATLNGELNPGTSEEKVRYHFAYSPGASAVCTESGLSAPAEPFPEVAGKHKKVSTPVTGLEGSTEYAVCLVAANPVEESEVTVGTSKTFKTLASKPTVAAGSENASGVKPTEARLAAVVNPENQTTECHFEYGKVITEHKVPCTEPSETIEGGEQEVATAVSGLTAATVYHYRVVVKNVTGETKGTPAEFETVRPPAEVVTGAANAVTSDSADLEGQLNAGGEATYYFEYGTAPCSGSSCGESSSVGEPVGGRTQESISPIEVRFLKPDTTYHYWLVATNGAGTVHGLAREFTTLNAPPSRLEIGGVENITTGSAVLTGSFNPGGESTYYFEYGPADCSDETATCGEKTSSEVLRGETQESIAPIAVSGLKANTIYHYWLVVQNAAEPEPIHGQAGAFRTAETQAEAEAEAATVKRVEEEAAAVQAGKQRAEEETRHQEAAAAAVAAATKKQYEEIAAVTASSKLQQEALARQEETIAATTVQILKVKVKSGGVAVTLHSSQAGNITVAGAGLKTKTLAKATAGTHTVTLALTSAGKKARKHHKKAQVTASLITSLTEVSASTTLKL